MFLFRIKNQSTNDILFAQDYGTRVFKKQGTDWEPVANKMGYPDGDNLLPTNQADPTGGALAVMPVINDINEPVIVRIVIVGCVKGNPAEKVGAFIDVLYRPSS